MTLPIIIDATRDEFCVLCQKYAVDYNTDNYKKLMTAFKEELFTNDKQVNLELVFKKVFEK